MTTPAIDRVATKFSETKKVVFSDVSAPVTSIGVDTIGWEADHRPESSNGTKVKGFWVCHPWTHNGYDWTNISGTAQIVQKVAPHQTTQWFGSSAWQNGNSLFPPSAALPSSNLINKAEVKALNKLKSQDLHLGNFLAEGDKVVDLVASTAKTIAGQVTNWRKRYPLDWLKVKQWQRGGLARRYWRCIPNSWLQLQYGWKPLMSDVMGAGDHLSRRSRFEWPHAIVKAGASTEDMIDKNVIGVNNRANAVMTYKHKKKVSIQLVYGLQNPTLAELSSLGLINPAEIIWELTRYSFVVDWFLPVGGWLSALTGAVGYNFITGTKSLKGKVTFERSRIVSIADSDLGSYSIAPPRMAGKGETFVRSCYTASPVPGLYVKNPISIVHALNSIALLAQSFQDKPGLRI
jgi:hypothetical protein